MRASSRWESQGRELLSMMKSATDMVPCAEDLGAIPECVPEVLSELGILGLRIPRWARRWHEDGQPYIPVAEYPLLSVCAPSVHDTSTLRGWWDEEDRERGRFWQSLGCDGEPPDDYTPSVARTVVERMLNTSSAICVFQLQDLLATSPACRHGDAADERVNVPGTVGDTNWSYRSPVTLEAMKDDGALSSLKPLFAQRRSRRIRRVR
jgi:4-alpha-glucanotransferase